MTVQDFRASMLIALAPSFTNCAFDEATSNATTHVAYPALFQTVERLTEMASAAGMLQAEVGRLEESDGESNETPAVPPQVRPPRDVAQFLSPKKKATDK